MTGCYFEPCSTHTTTTTTFDISLSIHICQLTLFFRGWKSKICEILHSHIYCSHQLTIPKCVILQGLDDLMDSRSFTVVMKCLNLNLLHDDFYKVRRTIRNKASIVLLILQNIYAQANETMFIIFSTMLLV